MFDSQAVIKFSQYLIVKSNQMKILSVKHVIKVVTRRLKMNFAKCLKNDSP